VKSGFCTIVGRPNVGKSTLLNAILGSKVTIVSDKPQTTRTEIRGVLHRPGTQVVFVDTPGIHKPRTLLGERLNDTATGAIADVDVVCLMIDATAPFGRGDRFIAERVPADAIVIVNKTDIASPDEGLLQLAAAAELDRSEYFPVSARTGAGIDALVDAIAARMPEGPPYYPDDMLSDNDEQAWVAELVREQLLAIAREELPHSIATRVSEWELPRVRVEIIVERESQKGIVIGKGRDVSSQVGTAVREQLPPGTFIELFVKVDKDWQRHAKSLERFGY
jgi:GTP-binding protein Era